MFKVGDKVTCLLNGKGVVFDFFPEPYCIGVIFKDIEGYYTNSGQIYKEDSTICLYHGHGTFKIEFVEDKEPEYEWQWLIQRDGVFDTSYFYENEEELKKDLSEDIKILYRIEESKREVKNG